MAIYNIGVFGGLNVKDCTADASKILEGYTAGVGKEIVEGTMPNNGDVSTAIVNGTVLEGYTSGGSINGLIAENVKKDVQIGGVVGTFDGAITGYKKYEYTDFSIKAPYTITLPENWKIIRCINIGSIYTSTGVVVRSLGKYIYMESNKIKEMAYDSSTKFRTNDSGNNKYMQIDGNKIICTNSDSGGSIYLNVWVLY